MLKHRVSVTAGEYVLEIKGNCTNTCIASSLSNNTISVYDVNTLSEIGSLKANSSISHIGFSSSSPDVLMSCCGDIVQIWDTRSKSLIHRFVNNNTEVFCFSSSFDDSILAVGLEGGGLNFWDIKTRKKIQNFEPHTEDVTQVTFHPFDKKLLLSASVDGLICTFDLTTLGTKPLIVRKPKIPNTTTSTPSDLENFGDISLVPRTESDSDDYDMDDEESQSTGLILNTDQSVSNFGFYGSEGHLLYSISHTENLTLWDLSKDEGQRVHDFGDARLKIGAPGSVDYLMTCYEMEPNIINLFCGNQSGVVQIVNVSPPLLTPVCTLQSPKGHTDIVRTVYIHTPSQRIITGGEDSLICMWGFDDTPSPSQPLSPSSPTSQSDKDNLPKRSIAHRGRGPGPY
eukprot:TRINITY_DN6918_c0_g1_i1.p1 TRINITY_DN6918_c0_g1~~TRINITY_DN6918_c0_g1_i1.p1  ORF type:complete len:399 (+),score=54.68 TRINITY_DN6918_c0_g1_i1:141-1337(+)